MSDTEDGSTSSAPSTPGHRENPAELLDATNDPGGFEFGSTGSEASSDLNWFSMLRSRAQEKATTSDRYPWWVLSALLAGLLALNITFTVFIVALPKVAGEFHTSITVLTWTMTGPLLAYGLAAPLLGKTGDIVGHRRLYLFGLAGAMVSAVLTALAPNVVLLLGARTLDGIQGAATGTASMALIMNAFPPSERVKAMGWWTLVGAGGPVIGVSLGSPIIQFFGWRALFWMQLVLLAMAFVVVLIILPGHRGDHAEHAAQRAKARRDFKTMDWIGSTSLSISVTGIMLALSVAPLQGWTSPLVLASWFAGGFSMIVFVMQIRRSPNPLIPAAYFSKRNFVMPMVIRGTSNFAYFGAFFLFPLLMEEGYRYQVGQVGAVAIARPLAFAICSPIAGYLAVKIGERTSTIIGTSALTLSMVLFATLVTGSPLIVIIIALALSGIGMGVAMPSTSSTMANEVDPEQMGVMSAAQMLAMQVGEVAGIQVLIIIQQGVAKKKGLLDAPHENAAALLSTFHVPFAVGGLVCAIGLVCAFFIKALPRPQSTK
ncbi:MAG: MFS transporter [Actinomycetes bacterium]